MEPVGVLVGILIGIGLCLPILALQDYWFSKYQQRVKEILLRRDKWDM